MSGKGNGEGETEVETVVPTADEISQLISTVESTVSSLTSSSSRGIASLMPLLGSILAIFAPNLTIAGMAATKILALASGLVSGIPDIESAWAEIKAAADGGAAPTAAQWAALDSAADAAHEALQAAIADYTKKP